MLSMKEKEKKKKKRDRPLEYVCSYFFQPISYLIIYKIIIVYYLNKLRT